MKLRKQMDTIFELLNAAKDELFSWSEWAKGEGMNEGFYAGTHDLANEINSFLIENEE